MKSQQLKYYLYILSILLFFFQNAVYAQAPNISSGNEHTLYACGNGNVYSWGQNGLGQCGRAVDSVIYYSPGLVSSVSNPLFIDAGKGNHSLALMPDGRVLAWGTNGFSQLGIGDYCSVINACFYSREPVYVRGGETGAEYLENVVAVSAGLWQSFAVLHTGEVVGWGANSYGQLGIGFTSDVNDPDYVRKRDGSRLTNIVKVVSGISHAYALSESGEVWAWGVNRKFQLGNGSTGARDYAGLVMQSETQRVENIVDIVAGGSHGLLLRDDGKVYGLGTYKGTDEDSRGYIYAVNYYATLISGGATGEEYLSNVQAIAAGINHSAVIVNKDGVRKMLTWGDNFSSSISNPGYMGVLGVGNLDILQFHEPEYVVDSRGRVLQNVMQIALGVNATFAEVFYNNNLALFVAGVNSAGQLGIGDRYNSVSKMMPVSVPNCSSFCSFFVFDPTLQLCSPFEYELQTNVDTTFNIVWTKNGTIIPNNTSPELIVDEQGEYNVFVSDPSGVCADYSDEISIEQIPSGYSPVNDVYCGNELTFSVLSDFNVNWYADEGGTVSLGRGWTFTVPLGVAEEVIPDSLYRLWTKINGCQAIPVYNMQMCDSCYTEPPRIGTTTFCHEDSVNFYIGGEYVRWYAPGNAILKHIGNYYTDSLPIPSSKQMLVTQTIGYCESDPVTVTLTIDICLARFLLRGRVWDGDAAVANCPVVVYDAENIIIPADTVYTNGLGEFRCETYVGTKYIVALAPNESTFDTWYGNKTSQEKAYLLHLDANIGGVDIQLQHETGFAESNSIDCKNSIFTHFSASNEDFPIGVQGLYCDILGQQSQSYIVSSVSELYENAPLGISYFIYPISDKLCKTKIIK